MTCNSLRQCEPATSLVADSESMGRKKDASLERWRRVREILWMLRRRRVLHPSPTVR